MALRDLTARIRLTADTRGVQRGFDEAESSARGFSTFINRWTIGISAAIGAVVGLVRQLSASLQDIRAQQALNQLLSETTTTASEFARTIQEATDSTISLSEATQIATRSLAQGLNTEQVEKLADIGADLARVYGIEATDAIERLTSGIVRQETEALELLGVTVRIGDATAAYAAEVGKSVTELTALERQTALYNSVVANTETAVRAAETAQNDLLTRYEQTRAALVDVNDQIFEYLLRAGTATESSTTWAGGINLASRAIVALRDKLSEVREEQEEQIKALREARKEELLRFEVARKNLEILRPLVDNTAAYTAELERLVAIEKERIATEKAQNEALKRENELLKELGFEAEKAAVSYEELEAKRAILNNAYEQGRLTLDQLIRLENQLLGVTEEAAESTEKLSDSFGRQEDSAGDASAALEKHRDRTVEDTRAQERLEVQTRRTTAALQDQSQVTVLTARQFDLLRVTIGETAAVQAALNSGAGFVGSSRRLSLRGGSRLVAQENTSLNGETTLAGGFVTLPSRGRTQAESRFFEGRTTII